MSLPPAAKRYSTSEAEHAAHLRALARDPATAPGRLRELATSARRNKQRRVLAALAANPSTPPDTLIDLVPLAPAAFCRNPKAPLLAQKMPDFVDKLFPAGLGLLLRSPRAPVSLVALVAASARYPTFAEAARLHVSLAGEADDDAWAGEVFAYWRTYLESVAENDLDARHAVRELVERGLVPAASVAVVEMARPDPWQSGDGYPARLRGADPSLLRVFEQARTTPQPRPPADFKNARLGWLRSLFAQQERRFAVWGTVLNPALAPDAMQQFAASWGPDTVVALAGNPAVPPDLLRQLAKHPNAAVRRAALRHARSVTPELRDECRRWLCKNALAETSSLSLRNAPPAPLARFAALLGAPETLRRPLLRSFGASPMWQNRLAAALAVGSRPNGRPPKPKHVALLRLLARDGNRLVRAAARSRLANFAPFSW